MDFVHTLMSFFLFQHRKTIQVISLLAALLEKHGTAQDKFDLEKCQKRIQQQLERHRSEQERTLRLGIVGPCFSNPTEGIIMSAWVPILVLVPPSVIENWRNEFQAWGYFGVAAYAGPSREQEIERIYNGLEEIMICGKSILQNEEDLLAVKKVEWKLIIVDEYHQYKNFRTKLYSGLKSLRDTCGAPIIGLTGTLMQNNHEELWSEVDLVNPGFLGTWEEFKDDTSVPIKLGRTKTADDAAVKEGNQVRDWLKTKLKSFYLQRRKADVLKDDLPEKNERVVFCELSPLQKRIYQHMMTLPDIVLVKYANAPCECGINQSIFQGFKQMRSEKEKIAYQRNHRNDIVPRKSCCHKRPLNIFRFHSGEEFYDPRAPLWRWQHEKLVQQDSFNVDTAIDCKSCPYCISFAVLDKLYKLSSHVSLLQLTKHPDDLTKGSRAWKDAKKALDFAKVAFPEDVLSMLPGGSYIREDGIMDDHASLSGKMKMLSDLLSEFNRRDARILLFSFSTQTLDLIQNFVKAQGYSYLRLDGNTPTRARQGLVDMFQKDNSIFLFLISTKAGGLGLNLTAANVVIVFDVDFNPSNDEQSQDRAYRIGQKRDVLVIRLVSRGTIEELKYIRQLYKLQLKHYTIGPSQAEQTYDETEAARMFRAVEGDKERKGELFGMENLLKFKDGSFLDELWKSKTMCDTGEWKGFEKFALHSALDIAGGMETLSKDGIEDVGGSISDEAFREAATRAISKEKGIKENDIRVSVENILQGQNTKSHQDFLRSDRGDALFKPGDTGFEEEMGGYSQAEHYVMENACIYGQRHDVDNSPTASRPSKNARNDQYHPSPLPLKPPRLPLNMSPPSPVTSASIVPIIMETNTEVGSKLPGNSNRRSQKPRVPRSVSSLNTSGDNGVSPPLPSYFKKTKLRFSSKDLYIPGKHAKRKKT
jgi:DNA excision repair protein ERCC-6-like 2